MHSKSLILLGGLLVFAACSSSQKKQEATLPATIVQTTKEVTIPVVAQPVKKEEPQKDEIVCERGQEKRTLRIETIDPKGCKLWYSQHSAKEPVASSHIANTHCEKVQATIRGHLEEAKFHCTGGHGEEKTVAKTMVATTPAPVATPTSSPKPTATPAASPKAETHKTTPSPSPTATEKPSATPTSSPVKK